MTIPDTSRDGRADEKNVWVHGGHLKRPNAETAGWWAHNFLALDLGWPYGRIYLVLCFYNLLQSPPGLTAALHARCRKQNALCRKLAQNSWPGGHGIALRRRCEGLRPSEGRPIKHILGLVPRGPYETGIANRSTHFVHR